MKALMALFLISHGLIHTSYLVPVPDDPKYPFSLSKGWFARLAGSGAKPIGLVLVGSSVICWLLAGLGLWGVGGLNDIWRPLVLGGAASSELLLILFWHRWLVLGLMINLVLAYGLGRLGWF